MDWTSMVTVGRIVRPQGNRGEVVVAPETDFGDERFEPGATVHVRRAEAVEPLRIAESRAHDGRWVVGFEGVRSINDAETLRDLELRIPEDALHPLGPNEYYAHDLVGCEVRTTGGDLVGRVMRIDFATAVPMLVVGDAEDVLVPMVDAICRRVDIAEKIVVIDPPDGLIDVNRRPHAGD